MAYNNSNNHNYYNYNNSYSYYWDYLSNFSMPLHLFFFIFILFVVLGFSWYINYESAFEETMKQVKLVLMLSPLLLLLLVHCLSAAGGNGFNLYIPLPERDSLHHAGGSPWGVALLLVFLMFMISYQSSLRERWFPLLAK